MDIQELRNFFDYEQVLDPDPQFLLDPILATAREYLGDEGVVGIQKAYNFARDAHKGQVRLSGEPYIVHPVKATQYLMEIRPDLPSIQACLMHDVLEDTPITYDEIAKVFGTEVADLCEGLVKVSSIKYKGEERQIETLKKTFLAMAKDLRVIFIKLVDRVHNIQTLDHHPKPEKRQRIALETLKIYAPLAKKLGIFQYHTLLENGAFKYLYPEAFTQIVTYMKKQFGDEKYAEKGIKLIKHILDKEGVHYTEVVGRLKSPYRIFQKLDNKYQTNDFSKVLDVLAFRVLTDSVGDCYNVLGIVHNNYTPLINKIKDYIAVPKFNGYKSIHTTVLGMFRFPVEVQIRTEQMNKIAEYGVAAHFAYAEKWGSVSVSDRQSDWIKKLQNLVKEYQLSDQKEDFKTELNIEILENNIFVYTPNGDIIEMPTQSTVLDFAFRVHTDVGLRFKNAHVNGIIKPIGYRPNTGDVIQINTFRNKAVANKSRFEYLHTPTARTKLTRFLRVQDTEFLKKKGLTVLNKKLASYGLPLIGTPQDKLSKLYDKEGFDGMLSRLAENNESTKSIIKQAYENQVNEIRVQRKKEQSKERPDKEVSGTGQVIIDGNKHISYSFVKDQKPVPEAKIIAVASKDGMKIHTTDDQKIMRSLSFDKLYEAHWEGEEPTQYFITVALEFHHTPANLMNIMSMYDDLKINVTSINLDTDRETGFSEITVTCQTRSPVKMGLLADSLKKEDHFIKLTKKSIL